MDNKEKPTPLVAAYNRMAKSTKTSGRINGEGYFTPNILIQEELKQPIDPESMGHPYTVLIWPNGTIFHQPIDVFCLK